MTCAEQNLDAIAVPTGVTGVYVAPLPALDFENPPPLLRGRPITAIAPHPQHDDRYYVTTEHPDALAFLPDPYIDLLP
ncbi:MAG: hypothetical protein KBH81_14175 [Phycisphaerae bacterium]|nr:hypothetical protein [Phycisphaerae bacterium]